MLGVKFDGEISFIEDEYSNKESTILKETYQNILKMRKDIEAESFKIVRKSIYREQNTSSIKDIKEHLNSIIKEYNLTKISDSKRNIIASIPK